jgi:LETM1 and EF-hand domain-containing protein 1
MRTVYGEGAEAHMKRQLRDWLDLSLSRGLPSSLLLLSRAFTITAASEPDKRKAQIESLKETLSTLPEEVIQDVGFEACAEEESRWGL